MVEKVVCVPEWVTEKRTITTTEYTQEPRTKTITCLQACSRDKGNHGRRLRDGPRDSHQERDLHGLQAGL